MQIDCDHYIDMKLKTPIIRVFSINKIGNSVLLHISGFIPYFYVQSPMNMKITAGNLEELRQEINRRATQTKVAESVVKIEVCERESIREFKGVNFPKLKFLKIYTAQPSHVGTLRGLFEKSIKFGDI
jgi:DNA polymerase delta subunit 1